LYIQEKNIVKHRYSQ